MSSHLDQLVHQARRQLDEQTVKIVRLHFDPQQGSPFWLEKAQGYNFDPLTDVTGFGLLGHLAEMVAGSNVGASVTALSVPLVADAFDFAAMGLVPGGAFQNRKFRKNMVDLDAELDPILRDLLFDPQTSGGLLMGCPKDQVADLLAALAEEKTAAATVIGEVDARRPGRIQVI